MLTHATQRTRRLAVFTPWSSDTVLLRRVTGREELSRPFEFQLEMLSGRDDLEPTDIVGHTVRFRITEPDSGSRWFHGYVNRFGYAGQNDQCTIYRATVVPWLWLLTKTADCRIFQQKTVPQIIETIFRDLGFRDFELSGLSKDYEPREYCVQYRETDFDFVSRLMEEEGIYYFFRQSDKNHTLVLADRSASYFELADREVHFADPDHTVDLDNQITEWRHDYEFMPGRWTETDYDFKTPSKNLRCGTPSVIALKDNANYEIYDFPGRYVQKPVGLRRTRVRMEEQEARHDVVLGKSTYYSFAPGGFFAVKTHRTSAEVGKSYTLVSVEYHAREFDTYGTGSNGDVPDGQEAIFENRFRAIPKHVPFRPQATTRKPIVEGPQTAFVVGPKGEEIYTDEFGRVKVQFHWDREGQHNENSSVWMRVSQVHAGQAWGGMDLPRIGEEVIVDFLEGDPDQPIVTGRVYNASSMPPFSLPAEKTRSGLKSQTHKGSGFNEISMDDTAGKEQIRMNAQYNMDTAVGNNQTLIVNVDRTAKIGNNDATTVGVDSSESVGNNKTVKVGNNMNVNVGNKLVMNAGTSITLKCGASQIHMNSGGVITITGTIITVAAAANASVVAPLTQVVGGAMLTTIGGINMMNGAVCHVGAAALASVAGGKVDVASAGETSIKGGLITLN